MITTATRPFVEGMRRAASRVPLPTSLGSRELALRLDGEVRRAGLFSARVENARVLQRIAEVTERIVGGATPASEAARARGESPVVLSPARAKEELLELLEQEGYEPPDPKDTGTIKDLRSDKRLDLIVETNEAVVHNHGRWVASQDATILDAFPAWELVRISPADEPRNWPTRWMMAGGTTYGGRMIALKGALVWDALGNSALFPDALGNPYPPFAWNSGMDVRDVSRREAQELGLIAPGQPAPAPDDRALTEGMQVDAASFAADLQAALAADPDLYMDAGVLRSR